MTASFAYRGFQRGVAWVDFQYYLYEECQSFCEAKRQRVPRPFGQANGASGCPVFALPSTMAHVPGNIVSTVMSALNASEPAMVYQPAECRVRYHS